MAVLVTSCTHFQVYSNENSGNSSPLRTREAPDASALKEDGTLVHILDYAELGTKVGATFHTYTACAILCMTLTYHGMAQLQELVDDSSRRAGEHLSDRNDSGGGDALAELSTQASATASSKNTPKTMVPEKPELTDAELELREHEQDVRQERRQFLRTSHDLEGPPEAKKRRNPATEPSSEGCPSLVTPSLDAYISEKDKDDLFKSMARGLLEYIGCFPLARKVPIPRKDSHDRDDKLKTKEERDREARLKAKAAAASKKRENKDQGETNKKKPQPPPPKTEKTALDFEYAIKRWLERTWKNGLSLVNTYQIGELMEKDVGFLLKGSSPILESKLESVWNGYGFETKSVPLADVSEWDWRDLAHRFRNQHLIGDKFFPSEEYESQVGLDAMRVQEPGEMPSMDRPRKQQLAAEVAAAKHETVLAREAIFWTKEAHTWEDSTHVGLSADFSASTQLIRWDFDDAGPIARHTGKMEHAVREEDTDDPSRPSTSNTLAHFIESSKVEWAKTREKTGAPADTADMRRSTSEPLMSHERKNKPMSSQITVTGKKRRELSDEQRQKQIEEEKAFRRFIKLHTGRTRVSQRKMEECREPFRLYKLQQKRVAAVGVYGGVLDDMESEFQEMLDEAAAAEEEDDDFMNDQKRQQKELIDQLFPPQSVDEEKENAENGPEAMFDLNFIPKPKEKVKEKPPPMPMNERLRVGSSLMTSIEASFANRQMTVGKTEVPEMLKTNIAAEVDPRDANEVSFDEFLRRPMKFTLARDPGLVKSLRLYSAMVGETGLNEFAVERPEVSQSRTSGRKRITKLPGLRASSGNGLLQRGRELVRSKSSLDSLSSDSHSPNNPLEFLVPTGLANCEHCLPRHLVALKPPPNKDAVTQLTRTAYECLGQAEYRGGMVSSLRAASNFRQSGLTSAVAPTPRRCGILPAHAEACAQR